jgi:alpha-glucuronidase
MNYYEGGASHIFPTFSGQYFQGGLQTFLSPEKTNVRGAGFLVSSSKTGWSTSAAYSYVLYRLSWNPNEDINQIAEDFAAINFGRDAAKVMAEI